MKKQKIIKPDKQKIINFQQIAIVLTFAFIWVFWSFFYKYNLYFQEQLQLFLLTTDYFQQSIRMPGGFIGYLGEFMTQFYLLPFAGASIITLLLLALQQFMKKLLFAISPNKNLVLLSLIPVVWYCMILTNEFYLLSGLIGVIIALLFSLVYINFSKPTIRAIAGLLSIPVVYFLTGGSYLLFLLVILVFELVNGRQKRLHFIWPIIFLIFAVAFPILIKRYFFATPILQAFISNQYYKISIMMPFPVLLIWFGIPVLMLVMKIISIKKRATYRWIGLWVQLALIFAVTLLGFKSYANMTSERTKALDYFVRKGDWKEVIKLADKGLPKNIYSVYYLNLALAKTGQLGEKMFAYEQIGKEGLFMPFKQEHISAMLGNEVFYQLGLINVSQQYIFESMEASPDFRKTVRAIKRLAETNLINGQYEVSRKYIYKLKQTLFYREWAEDAETYLYDDEKISRHPDWGEKRRIRPKQDYFFSIDFIDQILMASLHDNPQNKIAFEYLMAYYLLNKDLNVFMKYLPHAKQLGYKMLPQSYQEAILYFLGLQSENPEEDKTFPITDRTKIRLREYANVYTSNPRAEQILEKNYWSTYWYFFHYR